MHIPPWKEKNVLLMVKYLNPFVDLLYSFMQKVIAYSFLRRPRITDTIDIVCLSCQDVHCLRHGLCQPANHGNHS